MYMHILVATDGARLSSKAVNTAIELARSLGVRLTAIHVTDPYLISMYSEYAMMSDSDMPRSWAKAQRKKATAILEEARAKAAKAGVKYASATMEPANPYKAILATAKKGRCHLNVMASHGRRGLEGLIPGCKTDKVLTHGKLPVLRRIPAPLRWPAWPASGSAPISGRSRLDPTACNGNPRLLPARFRHPSGSACIP